MTSAEVTLWRRRAVARGEPLERGVELGVDKRDELGDFRFELDVDLHGHVVHHPA